MEVSDAGSNGLEDYGIQSLCCECKIIFDNWYERDNWSVLRPAHRHHNIVELQESAGKGCPVCAQLLQGLNDDVIQQMLKKRPKFKGFLRVENYSPPAQHYDVEIEFYDRLDGDDREILLDGSWETSVHLSPSGAFSQLPC
jgi:hypothetical protein